MLRPTLLAVAVAIGAIFSVTARRRPRAAYCDDLSYHSNDDSVKIYILPFQERPTTGSTTEGILTLSNTPAAPVPLPAEPIS